MTNDPKQEQKSQDIPQAATADQEPRAGQERRTDQERRTGQEPRAGQESRTDQERRAGQEPRAGQERRTGHERRDEPDLSTGQAVPQQRTGKPGDTTDRVGPGSAPTGEEAKPLHAPETRDPARPVHAPDATAGKATGRTPEQKTPGQKTPGQKSRDVSPRLFPQDESDKLTLRLQEALNSFIDSPRRSVEEAAGVLEEAAERLTSVLAERPRSLRSGWDRTSAADKNRSADGSDTEDLRLALQSYREVTERLLKI
jgi:hypothetical protein